MAVGRLGALGLAALAACWFAAAAPLEAQDAPTLTFPAAAGGDLMLGAPDRLAVPAGDSWQVVPAAPGAPFAAGAFARVGPRVVAGTSGSGLMVWDGPGSTTWLRRVDGLVGDRVTAVAPAGDGRRWWVGSDGGVSLWDGRVFVTFTPHNSALPGPVVTALQSDGGGGALVATWDGGCRIGADWSVTPWPVDAQAPAWPAPALAPWSEPAGSDALVAVAGAGAVHVLGPGGWTRRLLPFTPTCAFPWQGGGLLLGAVDGVWFLPSGPLAAPRRLASAAAVRALAAPGGQVWAAASEGVRVLGSLRDLGLPEGSVRP